jgi:small subunit ribosomal protein S6
MSAVRQYELVYITAPDITDDALAELHRQVAAVVERFGGVVDKTENWGRRKLAYEIGHQREGVYVLHLLSGPPPMTAELDRRLRVIDTVLRHLIVRVDEELAVAERARTRRKAATVSRRLRRGLPPEPTETERHRREEDDDDLEPGLGLGDRVGGDR